jgi:RNA polymerase sigma-70 factor (ECF subfamily)
MSSSAARYFPGALANGVAASPAQTVDAVASSAEAVRGQTLTQARPTGADPGATTDGTPSLALPSDEVLMCRICKGDKEALADLFHRYARAVRAVTYRVLRDTSEADDMLQDVFLLVHRGCQSFDSSKGSARSWILQMAYRRAISRRRYLAFRHFYTRLDLDDGASQLADPRTSGGRFEDSADGRLGNGGLQKAFEALSEDQRQTLRLHFFEGHTFDEIAAALRQPKGNIRHHYFRGLDKLRKHIFDRRLQSH